MNIIKDKIITFLCIVFIAILISLLFPYMISKPVKQTRISDKLFDVEKYETKSIKEVMWFIVHPFYPYNKGDK